jgi:glycosyltransferase involved in cell wall biosynthesis
MAAPATSAPRLKRVLVVSSFVLPRPGGVEQFVAGAAALLRAHGWNVRVLACRPREGAAEADITVPTVFVRAGGWPLPVGGWRALWREIGRADVVVVNGTRHVLPNVATFVARLRRTPVLFVLHGSGASFASSSFLYHRVLGSVFERLVSRPALRLARPVSLSQAGVAGSRKRYGVAAAYVPYPLRVLPPAGRRILAASEPVRVVWVGRLYGEKDPLGAVAVVERVRRQREATLELYGDGFMLDELQELARERPWLTVSGRRTWEEIQQVQAQAHICLSTSLRDATQIAILEPLVRGIPVVSTRVGDAPGYYARSLRSLCVEPADPDAAADAILEIAASYDRFRERFSTNAHELRRRHALGGERLARLVETAAHPADGAGASSRAELPVT